MRSLILVVTVAIFGSSAIAEAQMFGARTVGQPLSRRNAAQLPPADNPLESRRFVRESRGSGEFVGRDNQDTGFVGNVGASDSTAPVNPATPVIQRPDLAPVVNRPVRVRRPNTLLDPPLALGFQLSPETIARRDEKATKSIARVLSSHFENQISVSVVDQTAILRGWARDEEQKRLAEILAELEPGIVQVQNEIVVLPLEADR